jgi:hypothetical protein
MYYFDFNTEYVFIVIMPIANKAKGAKEVHLYDKLVFVLETVTRYQK